MDRSDYKTKSVIVATRVTPNIKKLIERMALREGLSVSEWLRNLIVSELKEEEALPPIRYPKYDVYK
jgi:hypothetical protein